jgi:cytochrome c oxidase cbb3-type subunit 3
MSSPFPSARPFILLAGVLALAGCQRESRDYHGPPPPAEAPIGVSPTDLQAGGRPMTPQSDPRAASYEKNAFHMGEGKRYYDWYNCYGCHAAGGGDIGPPLMDDRWRYGGSIEQIHASIAEGRANGMPAFRGVIPDEQIWEISAYIRSLAGNVPKDVPASRGDEMSTGEAKTQVNPTPVTPGQDITGVEAGR